jgi:hypothetical protein
MSTSNVKTNKMIDLIDRSIHYMEYLRIHSYGRRNRYFKRNRNMLNPDDKNNSRSGWQSYIQRAFRDIIQRKLTFIEKIKKDRYSATYICHAAKLKNIENVFESDTAKYAYLIYRNKQYSECSRLKEEAGLTEADCFYGDIDSRGDISFRIDAKNFNNELDTERNSRNYYLTSEWRHNFPKISAWDALKIADKIEKQVKKELNDFSFDKMFKRTLIHNLENNFKLKPGVFVYKVREPSDVYAVLAEEHRGDRNVVLLKRLSTGSEVRMNISSIPRGYKILKGSLCGDYLENEKKQRQEALAPLFEEMKSLRDNSSLSMTSHQVCRLAQRSLQVSPERTNDQINNFNCNDYTDSELEMMMNPPVDSFSETTSGDDTAALHNAIDDTNGARGVLASLRTEDLEEDDTDDYWDDEEDYELLL